MFYVVTCILFTVDAVITGSTLYIVLNVVSLIFLAVIIMSLAGIKKSGT